MMGVMNPVQRELLAIERDWPTFSLREKERFLTVALGVEVRPFYCVPFEHHCEAVESSMALTMLIAKAFAFAPAFDDQLCAAAALLREIRAK